MAEERSRAFSFSSETPVERWFGNEILDHSPGSVRIKFLKSGRAPLLMSHDQRIVLGVIETAVLKDKVGRGVARFGRSARSEEALRDVDDGILVNTSVGYRVHEMRLESSKENLDTYRITDWEPFEASLVGIPADPEVGVGRHIEQVGTVTFSQNATAATAAVSTTAQNAERSATMTDPVTAAAGASAERKDEPKQKTSEELMQERRKTIVTLCRGAQLDERFVENFMQRGNLTYEQIAEEILKAVQERSKVDPQTPALLGMERKDVQRYSVLRALRASMTRDWSKAGLELEAHKAIVARGQTPRGDISFFVPYDVQIAQKRDMTVAGVSGSQFLVGTDHLGGSFIDLLRNQSIALQLGVTRLTGLKGNVAIPRQTAGGTVFWLADENTQITESQPTIGQLNLAPKNVAALTEISHTLVAQSDPSVETLVLNNIARDIGTGIDVAIIRGSGASGQPQGIVGTSGVGAVTGTSLAYAGILEFQTDVGAANALGLGGAAYVTTFAIAADMKNTMIAANTFSPIWRGRLERGQIDATEGAEGYPAVATGNMSAGHMMFGAWPSVVLAEWGVLELMMNPFSDFTRGLTSIRGWYTVDVGMRYPGAFSVSTNVT